MKRIKKLACGVIVLCMILSMLPMTAFASTVTASGTCGENLTWELTDDGVLTISGTGEMTDFWEDKAPWLSHSDSITEVVIEAGVTSIGYAAFGGCAMTKITIPEGVTRIGGAAFVRCAMTEITIPEGVTSIGWSAFVSCGNLTSLTIPASVTNIEEAITAGCVNLKEILVSEGNPNYCSDEFGVLYNKDKTTLIQYPCGREGASYSIPASVTNIGERAFYNCQNLTSVSLPEGITSISRLLFDGCHNLTNITIPDSVISIGEQAFSECYSLTSITIPDKVTSIGKFAFNDCDGLSSITIPASVTSIEENVFGGCYSLKEILVREENPNYCSDEFGVLYNKDKTTLIQYPSAGEGASYSIPASVTSIETNAFVGCGNLQKITFNGNAPAIDDLAFMYDEYVFAYYPANDATWTEDVMQDYGGIIIWVPSGSPTIASGTCGENMTWELTSECVMTISGTGAMANCEWDATHWPRNYTKLITSVVIEDGVTGIGNCVFQSCENLTDITIPNSVTSIGDHAFEGCESLADITIPEGVTSIGNYAFAYCESLTSITIPSSVTELGEYPFDEHIKEITFEGSAPDGVWDALDCLTATVYYPASDDTWTANVWWQESLDNITWVPTGHQHVWGQWETVKAATATTDGEKRRECEGCDAYETEVIPAWETVVSPVIIAPTGDFEISTPENSQISAEEAEKTLFAMFYDLELFEQPDDTGINANTAVIEAAKANIRDDDGNPVVGANYLTSLLIGVGMCYVDAEGDTPVVTKITYDVVPCLVALDADGNILGYAEMHELDSEVTFHLPVDKNTAADSAKVEHEGELMGYFSIKTDANGNKYVVVKSSSFSNYTVELHHHVYGDDGICDICGFNPNGNPNGKPDANPENPKTGDNGQLLLWAVLFLTGVFGIVALVISNDKKLYEGKYLN